MNIKALLCAALLFSLDLRAQCSTNLTLVAGGPVTSLTLDAGQLAKVTFGYLASLTVTVGGKSFTVAAQEPFPRVAGPATISLPAATDPRGSFCTIEVSDPGDSFVPSNAVVVPADSGGPVTIVLESSADLVTWTAALPGTYGTSTTNRFFRVRAVRGP
jgi:hypothetical protein